MENAGSIFYEIDAKTEKLVDAGRDAANSLDNLQAEFDKTDRAAARTGKVVTDTGKSVDGMGKRIDKGAQSASKFTATLTPLAAAVAGVITVQTLKAWGQMAEQFTLFQARITRLSADVGTARATYQSLLKISSQTGSSMGDTVKLWESLTGTLKSLGATNAQVLTLTATLQKIGTIGGSSAEETSNALRQLAQGLAGGTLRAEEFNSVVENTPELARQIAKGFGVSMGQLRQMLLDGQITAEKLFDVLLGRTQEVNTEFEKLPRTIGQAANALTTEFGAALSVIDKATGASNLLAQALDAVARGVQRSFNPTDQERLNELLRERADLQNEFAQRVGTWAENGRTAQNQAKQLRDVEAEILEIQNRRVNQQKKENEEQAKATGPKAAANTTADGQKAIQQLAEQNALIRAQGEERAKLAAIQKLGASATQQERDLAGALAVDTYRLAEAEKTRNTAKKKDLSDTAKLETKAQADARRAAKEQLTAREADQKQFAQLGQAIANVGQTAREAAQDAAQLSLSKFATPDEIQRVRDMAGALYDLKGARAALAQADPIAAQQINYDDQLKQLQTLNEQKLISDQRYLELKHQAEVANAEQMKILQEENFKAASLGNELMLSSLDALATSGTQAIAGLISGTGSLQEALGGIANTVLQTVVGAFVQMGVDWVKQQIMMQAAASATTATQVAGTGAVAAAQAGATASIAATTTATAATTGTAVASSMAPAAGLSSIASFGGAAVIGGAALLATMLLAKSFGGGRRAGGAVNPGSVYRVNEGGAPEIFTAGGQQYMIPNQRGEVVSNKNAEAAGGGGVAMAPIVNINNYSGQAATTSSRYSEADRAYIIDVIVGDQMAGGKSAHSTNSITGTKRRGN
jgi:tape measure domain-containing protein